MNALNVFGTRSGLLSFINHPKARPLQFGGLCNVSYIKRWNLPINFFFCMNFNIKISLYDLRGNGRTLELRATEAIPLSFGFIRGSTILPQTIRNDIMQCCTIWSHATRKVWIDLPKYHRSLTRLVWMTLVKKEHIDTISS